MSNWYGTARSNYVRVKDMGSFLKALEPWPIKTQADLEGRVALFSEDGDSGGWPSVSTTYDGDDIEFDAVQILAPHLADGEVIVMMEAGAEKERYVTGCAFAFDNTGQSVQLLLTDIYKLAAEKLGVPVSSITAAEY